MTGNQTEETKRQVQQSIQTSRVAQWIEDPVASALLATGVTSVAICFVLTGMWLVNVAIY